MDLIGISGPARSGKDTAADYLCKCFKGHVKIAFADTLKSMLAAGLGLTYAQVYGDTKDEYVYDFDASPRDMLQTLGTDWGREMVHPDIWITALHRRRPRFAVVPDVRFENEAAYIRKHGGRVIHIVGRGGIDGNHSSEDGIIVRSADAIVENVGGVTQFYDQLHRAFPGMMGPSVTS